MSQPSESEIEVFNATLELPVAERVAYLDQVCAGDAPMRRRVELLILAHESAGTFLHQPTLPAAGGTVRLPAIPTEKPGDKIGRYKLLEKIGEGGCGVVYMAEQEEPVRRRVALKVIKLGMDTKQVIARFEAERQALAMMDHPNIAKVLDAGATDTGRPYFVMELVRGIKITDFCDENKLPTEDRLKLFIQVCQAIQHAHQKGVIHRDIKPSNILVTINDGVPVPKVIDFGIAKATAGRLTDQTLFTAFEQFIGTPAYMSPEQAVMTSLDIDTRSDIYSLGVLLYELLTGGPPFDQKELLAAGLDEMRRTIREKEPPKPSTRLGTMAADALTTTAKHHHTDAPKLIHLLRGDLDWIVMKSLDKDRARRYETANGLAMDVERYLNTEPVNARPASALYRLQKTVLRNKAGFAAAALIVVSLMVGLSAVTWMFLREREALKLQAQLRQEAEAAHITEALSRRKAEAKAKILRATLLRDSRNFSSAEKLLNEIPTSLIERDPTHAALRRDLGCREAREGRWQSAVDNFVILLRLDDLDELNHEGNTDAFGNTLTLDYLFYGPALIELKHKTEYESFRQSIVKRFIHTTNSVIAERVCKVSLLLPADANLLMPLATLYDAAAVRQEDPSLPLERKTWTCLSLALVDYRRIHDHRCIEWCERCLASPYKHAARTAAAEVILAMANQRLNQSGDSQEELTRAATAIEEAFLKGGAAYSEEPQDLFFDWMFARILLREAEGLLGQPLEVAKAPGTVPKMKVGQMKRIVPACDGRVCVSPGQPPATASVFIQFFPADANLALANVVKMHLGWNNWNRIVSPDAAMIFNSVSNCWEYVVTIPVEAIQLDCVFNNGNETWDKNGGADWHFAVTTSRISVVTEGKSEPH